MGSGKEPTVYITSDVPSLDFSPALRWSKNLRPVFPPGQIHLSPQEAIKHARAVLSGFSDDDYLALVGDPVKIAVCAVAAAEQTDRVKFLRYNRTTREYILVGVDFHWYLFAEKEPS